MKQKVRGKLTIILSAFLILVAGIISVTTAQASSFDSKIADNFISETKAFISNPFTSLPKIINGGANIISIDSISAADKNGAPNINSNSSDLSGKKITNPRIVNPISSIGAFFSSLPNKIYQQLSRATDEISSALAPFLSESRSNIIVYRPIAAPSVNKIITSPALASQSAAINSENSYNNQPSSITNKNKITSAQLVGVQTTQKNNTANVPKTAASNVKYATPSDLAELEIRMLAAIEKAKQEVSTNANSIFYNWAAMQSLTHLNTPTGGGGITIGGSSWPSASGSTGQVLTTDGSGSLAWSSAASSGSGTVSSGSIGQISYFAAAGATVSGTSSLIIDTDQDIGIGTTTPWADLSVNGLPLTGGTVPVFVVATSTSGYVTSTALIVNANGLVGIGTSSPAASFSLSINGPLYVASNAVGGNTISTFAGAVNISGYMGIGTTTPAWNLQVANTRPFLTISDTAAVIANQKHWFLSSQGGNLYIGTSSDSYATNTISALTILNNGNAGIGTSSPFASLALHTINGPVTTPLFAVASSTWGVTPTTTLFIINPYGKVGIGTSTPGATLSVMGTSTAPVFMVSTSSGATNLTVLTVDSTGRVGIGTSSPATAFSLSVNGPIYVAGNTVAANSTSTFTGGINIGRYVGIGTTSPTAFLTADYTGAARIPLLYIASSTTNTYSMPTSTYFMIDPAGRIGIGTSSPFARLTMNVNATTSLGNIPLFSISSSTLAYGIAATSTPFFIGFNGLVGIGGTTTPTATLSIMGTSTAPVFMVSTSTSQTIFMIDQNGNIGIGTSTPSLNGTNGGINLVLGSGNASSSLIIPKGAICVDADGGCIATSTGFVSALGFYASASDVAEQYRSDEQLQAGDIVMIKDNQLVGKAVRALEGKVMGVVSAKPGLRLGPSYELDGPQAMTDQYPVALVGRVLINVSNEAGKIAVGDKITISSLDGIGMKSTDSSDSIVGMALQPFDSNLAGETVQVNGSEVKIGKILIFVNLSYARTLSQQVAQKNLTLNSNGGVEGIGVINSQDLIQGVRDTLAALGAVIENGVAKIQKLIVGIIETQELKVGSPEKPSGVTIYDHSTGKPYCVYVESGQLQTAAGECSQISQNNQNSNSIGEQPAVSPAPNQPTETVEPQANNSPQPAEPIEPSPSSQPEVIIQPSSEATATESPSPVFSEPPTTEPSQPSPSEPSQPSASLDQSADNSSLPTI